MKLTYPLIPILLTSVLAMPPLTAQQAAPAPSLQLLAVDQAAGAKGMTVEVRDEAGAPVANAAVIFRLPNVEGSSTFADGTFNAVTYTDANGRAHTDGIQGTGGAVPVRVTAVKGTAHAGLLIEQTAVRGAAPATVQVMPVAVQRSVEAVKSPVTVSAPAVTVSSPAPRMPGVMVENRAASKRLPATVSRASLEEPAEPARALPDYDSPDANVPIRHTLTTGADAADLTPRVSITSSGAAASSPHSKKKWLIAAAIAAGAGAALALAHSGSSGSTSSTSGVTVGPPTVSVGHP